MSLVFISHVAEDGALAAQLAHGLDAAGYPTWYYERDSLPGPSYLDQILHALAQSSAVVALLSPAALTSWQVDKEVVQAHERGLPFLPVLRGLTHDELHAARPAWAMAFGAAVSLTLPTDEQVTALLPRIVAGLRWLAEYQAMPALPPTPPDLLLATESALPLAPAPAGASSATPRPPLEAGNMGETLDNLPLPPTPLIGREQEVEAVTALLGRVEVRLVTLTGPGGCGKTRLALQIAADLRPAFPDGTIFVNLALLSDPAMVPATIAQALGVREDGTQALTETLRAFLHHRRLLLLLDNCEQVVEAAPLVAELLASCPFLKVLATSRVSLRVRGEHEVLVPPLAVPDPAHLPALESLAGVAAVALFIARAQEVKATFALTGENATEVAAICARLEGLPLAIELAAARIKIFPPTALLRRLSDRLGLLVGGARDLPERQQTLRATIDWSYDVLKPEEQVLLARLGIFAGGSTLEAIEAVCNPEQTLDVLAGVEALIERSLLGQAELDGETRFVMLETIRDYARERLAARGEVENVRHAHARYFLALAEEAQPYLNGPRQAFWLERLEREHDNLRAALRWAQESDTSTLELRLTAALWRFWDMRGHLSEGRGWLEGALARAPSTATAERAQVLAGAGQLADRQGAYARATALLEESLALWRELGDQHGVASALQLLGWVATCQGNYEHAQTLYQESLTLLRTLGDQRGIANTLNNLGIVAEYQGDYARATALYEQSLTLRRTLGDQRGIARSLNNLGLMAVNRGDYERASVLYEESLALKHKLGDQWGIAGTLDNLGQAFVNQGDYARATALYEQSLTLRRALGDQSGIAATLNNLAIVAINQGNYERATALSEENLALVQASGYKEGIADCLANLGCIAHQTGQDARATTLFEESMRLAREMGSRRLIQECIAGLALVAAGQGQPARAARLLGAVTALHSAIGASWSTAEQARQDRVLTELRVALGDAAFQAAWAEGAAMSLEQAVAAALQEPDAAIAKGGSTTG